MSEESPGNFIVKNLNQEMRCGIFTNPQGEILIIHDLALQSEIQWVEYDPNEQTFSIIHEDGRVQELGIPFNQKIKDNLSHGQEVTLAHMIDKKIQSSQKVIFVIREH